MDHWIDTVGVRVCADALYGLTPCSQDTTFDLNGVSPTVAAAAEDFFLWYRSTWLGLDSALTGAATAAHHAATLWEATESGVVSEVSGAFGPGSGS